MVTLNRANRWIAGLYFIFLLWFTDFLIVMDSLLRMEIAAEDEDIRKIWNG